MGAKFCRYFTSHDAFGQPITLNYRGASTYKTGCGAIMTLTYSVLLLAYVVVLGRDFALRLSPFGQTYTIKKNINDNIPKSLQDN